MSAEKTGTAAATDSATATATATDTDAVGREFAAALGRLGIEMPPDLAPGVLAGYRSLRASMELLREVENVDV